MPVVGVVQRAGVHLVDHDALAEPRAPGPPMPWLGILDAVVTRIGRS